MSKPLRVFLFDGSALAYRSHYAFIRNPLRNSQGLNTSAAFGFTRERRFFGFNYGGDDLAAATEDVIGLISVAARDGVDPTAFDRVVASGAVGELRAEAAE